MTDKSEKQARLAKLLANLFDERSDDLRLEEITDLIQSGEADEADIADQVSLHAALAWRGLAPRPFSAEELSIVDSAHDAVRGLERELKPSVTREGKRSDVSKWLLPLFAAAATVLLSAIIVFWPDTDQRQVARSEGSGAVSGSGSAANHEDPDVVATLVDAVGADVSDLLSIDTKDSIYLNQTLEIESGLIHLDFHCGADAVLKGPARLRIIGHKEVRLESGKLSVRMRDGIDGFLVNTPSGLVRDLGTAFGVDVSRRGASHVAVYDGAVDVTSLDKSHESRRIVKGEAIEFLRDGSFLKKSFDSDVPDVNQYTLRKPDVVIPASRDAFVRGGNKAGAGKHHNYGNSVDLRVKFDTTGASYNRRAWIGFDLSGIDSSKIVGARLTLTVLPNRIAEIMEPSNKEKRDTFWKFEVAGLWDLFHEDWTEDAITWQNAPGNAAKVISGQLTGPHAPISLGTFRIRSRGNLGDKAQIAGPELLDFLRSDDDGDVTMIVSRRSGGSWWDTKQDRVVHGFASREHEKLDPPTLELWIESPSVAMK